MKLSAILTLLGVCFGSSEPFCAMYDNCGKKSLFGPPLPCARSQAPAKPSGHHLELLRDVCGDKYTSVCCSEAQLESMKTQLKKLDPLVSSCPACRRNFYEFVCEFTCSPHQNRFVEVTKTQKSTTNEEIVVELNQYVAREYAQAFFDSCKNVKFSATNGYAMDLIGGGATTYEGFLKFMNDEKSMLGGSPFQINIVYEGEEYEPRGRKGDMRACDDDQYKCACSDCENSCPRLAEVETTDRARVFRWCVLGMVAIGGMVAMGRRKKKEEYENERNEEYEERNNEEYENERNNEEYENERNNEEYENERNNEEYENEESENENESNNDEYENEEYENEEWENHLNVRKNFTNKVFSLFLSYPHTTIFVGLFLALLASLGLFFSEVETDPIGLWVSPHEPALQQYRYFEEKFGEWFRIEQIIVKSTTDEPVLNWDTVQWWLEQEQVVLQGLEPICFKPLGETCGVQSFTQYFAPGSLTAGNWRQQLKACAESPVNCLPSFQQPLKPSILFDRDDVLEARAFIVTILVNSDSNDPEHTARAVAYEHALQAWAQNTHRPGISIAYSTQVSLEEELARVASTDVYVIAFSYLCMFIYASVALGGRIPRTWADLLDSNIILGLQGIFLIAVSVTASAGLFSFFGLKSTLIIAEVIPFLVLAVGIDNVFLLVGEAKKRPVLEAVSSIAPSCCLSAFLQISTFLLATRVDMPAVKNFAWYSAGGVLINFLLQMTVFVSMMGVQKRGEEGEDIGNHKSVSYSTFLLLHRRLILSLFFLWSVCSLLLLPSMELGLDQRIALPQDSYLQDYFDSVYEHLQVGPPLFLVVRDANVTDRAVQKHICGKFGGCDEFSLANILEQEYRRGEISTVGSPASSWLDDFLTYLNPTLDQCCRRKKNSDAFCAPYAPDRQCDVCYADKVYESSMEGLPEGQLFLDYFDHWIEEPSDPCPLGGKAPYSSSVHREDTIDASYLRSGHRPLRSQGDFIDAFLASKRIAAEIRQYQPSLDVFAFSPFYVFFVQYENIVQLTAVLLGSAVALIFACTAVSFGVRIAGVLAGVVAAILINIMGLMVLLGVSLNAVSLVNLVICAGIAVEFTIHLTRRFAKTGSVEKSLEIGGSILSGITLTKVVGVGVLGFARSRIFEVYYFRLWLVLVGVGGLGGLVGLPLLLSLLPSPRAKRGAGV